MAALFHEDVTQSVEANETHTDGAQSVPSSAWQPYGRQACPSHTGKKKAGLNSEGTPSRGGTQEREEGQKDTKLNFRKDDANERKKKKTRT